MVAITPGTCLDQSAITPAETYCICSQSVESIDDLFVHSTDKNHLHHVHRVGIGDSQTVTKFRGNIEPLQPGVDLWASAMNHHRLHSHTGQQGDVAKDGVTQLCVDHGRTAVLDHDSPTSESLDVRKGLAQDGDPLGIIHAAAAQGSPCSPVVESLFGSRVKSS